MLLLRTNSHVLCIVHIRPPCEITYSAGAAPAESAFKEAAFKEATIANKIQQQESVGREGPDTETDEAIRAAVAKNLSDDRHVADTRMFVAEQMPHRQQCSSVVSDHLERDLPRLQADLDSIRIVFTKLMRIFCNN